ncbi:uncharacterized protein L3040_001569 [Drepanopeziza brunnea f. sp. 'multigermtubi']|uniref:NAD-dependent epimerase/dehydratase domain-containing protein n=1 Tax=Marssonina brunnea f. sp. multigermtubi (strain MB_m1) TaxID=1072389 RepID=K1WCW6_MARBU|nr:putative Protein fmp52 [Drepanopeziza brunnea f. sp. 'multigermtubi' MB_m1]EKD15200.1 putative Protein fmp52 [Drepanopeziza brunnea f. sp. 'multigermtubi' MB_m1]KAJ5051798.1 hypothetical protein L3040_001569 [Drepanopeziza brunnea f. sp. 'multigermtubi']
MASIAIIGSTGLVGSQILSTLLSLPSISSVHAIARRQPPSTDPKLHPLINADTAQWASSLASVKPAPDILLSALGTTRAAAGGIDNQRKIDLDLNVEVARAAKAAGVKIYVLVSSGSASSASRLPYSKMKGELEDAVKAMDFEHTVILRPGLLVGSRKETRLAEGLLNGLAKGLGAISGGVLKDFWAQDAEVVARAGVSAALQTLEGGKPKVWEVGMGDIVRLGRTEWKA